MCTSLPCPRIVEVESQAFVGLPHLRSLDLSANLLSVIHPEALRAPASLRDLNLSHALLNLSALPDLASALRWGTLGSVTQLDLSANGLVLLPPAVFLPLGALRRLLLGNNSLVSLQSGSLRGLEQLAWLDLSLNGFRTFRKEALGELDRLGGARLLLGGNPFACVCGAEDFADWLNDSYVRVADGDRLVCASPPELYNMSLRALGGRGLGCHGDGAGEGAELALQTSYAFLGVVLGLVGVVFLCVLYLNRTGIKKWVTDLRETCQDVLEGYQYRYEIDSDPRLGPPPSSAHL